jgi:hypothetical protein
MSTSPLDLPPEDGLARAFRLPEHIQQDAELVALYDEMVERLRREALGLSMTTMQQLLIERLATKYVIIRYNENTGWQGLSITAEKDMNAQWSDLLKEWNRMLQAGQEKMRDALLGQFEKISQGAVDMVHDKETRQSLRRHFREQFASMGY